MERTPERDAKQSTPDNIHQCWKVSGDAVLGDVSGSRLVAAANTVPLLLARIASSARAGRRLLHRL